jgi:hypothetical protein
MQRIGAAADGQPEPKPGAALRRLWGDRARARQM